LPGDVAVPPGAAGVAVVLSEPNGPGRLAVLGSRAARRVVRGGEASVIEVFLRCDARARAAWDVFLHLDAPPPDRRPRAANGDHGFAGGRVPTSACRPGELLVDRWDLEIPDGAAEGTYQLFFGLWSPQGGARMTVAPSFATVSPGSEGIAMPEEYRDRVYLGDLIVTR
jgi:hypothetical protein